jgi:PAS domain S-box-containing protein
MYNENVMELSARIEQLAQNLESLIEKAELWQMLFDESPDAIALFDSRMRFFLVNKKFCELTGFERSEITNQKLSIVIPAEYRRVHKAYEKSYSKDPVTLTNRHGLAPRILTRDGEPIAVDIDLSHFTYDDRKFYTAFIRKVS